MDEQGDLDAYYRQLETQAHAAASLSPEVADEDALRLAVEDVVERSSGGSSGKRSRDEVDSGWGGDEDGPGKKVKVEPHPEQVPDDDSDDDDFDEVDPNADPDPICQIGDRSLPYSQIMEDMTDQMTPDQYTVRPFPSGLLLTVTY